VLYLLIFGAVVALAAGFWFIDDIFPSHEMRWTKDELKKLRD
jgi:hypothetical protein